MCDTWETSRSSVRNVVGRLRRTSFRARPPLLSHEAPLLERRSATAVWVKGCVLLLSTLLTLSQQGSSCIWLLVLNRSYVSPLTRRGLLNRCFCLLLKILVFRAGRRVSGLCGAGVVLQRRPRTSARELVLEATGSTFGPRLRHRWVLRLLIALCLFLCRLVKPFSTFRWRQLVELN